MKDKFFNEKKEEINKEEFMELYKKVVNEEIDYKTLDEETVKKMCELLKEEIIIRTKHSDEINKKNKK